MCESRPSAASLPRATSSPRAKASSSGAAAACMVLPKMVWPRSAAKTSPVIKVWNCSIRPRRASTHLLCVPGRPMSTGASAGSARPSSTPSTWVSSPRITLGSAPGCSRPGTMCNGGPLRRATTVRPRASSCREVGVGRYLASRQPWALPTMPQASRGRPGVSASQSPQVSCSACSKAAPGSGLAALLAVGGKFMMPQGRCRVSSTSPCAPMRKARNALVPQSRAMRPASAGTRKRAGTMCFLLNAPSAAPAGPAAAQCRSGRAAPRGAWPGRDGGPPRRRSHHLPS